MFFTKDEIRDKILSSVAKLGLPDDSIMVHENTRCKVLGFVAVGPSKSSWFDIKEHERLRDTVMEVCKELGLK